VFVSNIATCPDGCGKLLLSAASMQFLRPVFYTPANTCRRSVSCESKKRYTAVF
jgi:hypothetical protein